MSLKNNIKKPDFLFVSSTDTIKVFNNKLLEKITTTDHRLPFVIFTPIILYFLYESILFVMDGSISQPYWIILLFLCAVLIWTMVEYICHRYIFHYNAKTKVVKKLLYIIHWAHHDYPNDAKRVVLLPIISIPGATLFYLLAYLILGRFYAAPFTFSLFSCYLLYDWFHYASHHLNIDNDYYNLIKKYHLHHHYKNPNKGFGFITTLWDHIMRTNF